MHKKRQHRDFTNEFKNNTAKLLIKQGHNGSGVTLRLRGSKDHGVENMATLPHIVLNFGKQKKSFKVSVQTKRLKAA